MSRYDVRHTPRVPWQATSFVRGHDDTGNDRVEASRLRWYYNEHGQPVDLDGKPGGKLETHIPMNSDGSYPTPKGWKP